MDTVTLAELDAMEKRAKAATPFCKRMVFTRYYHGGARLFIDGEAGDRTLIADFYHENDREFYFAARTDLPRLIATVRHLESANASLRRQLDALKPTGHEE